MLITLKTHHRQVLGIDSFEAIVTTRFSTLFTGISKLDACQFGLFRIKARVGFCCQYKGLGLAQDETKVRAYCGRGKNIEGSSAEGKNFGCPGQYQ